MTRSSLITAALMVALVPASALAQDASGGGAPPVVVSETQLPVVVAVPAPEPAAVVVVPVAPAPAPEAAAEAAPPRAVAPAAVASRGPRFRFGIAGNLTIGAAQENGYGRSGGGGPGITLDVGLQINDNAAVYLRGQVSSILFVNQASGYAIAEWTPVDWFSLGSGIGVDGMAMMVFDGNGTWSGVSVPLVVGFNIGGHRAPDESMRRVFRIGLEGAVGSETRTGAVGWHTTLTLGFTMM